MLLRLLEVLFGVFIFGGLLMEVLWPALKNTPMFPHFRTKLSVLEDEQKRVKQVLAEQAIAEEIAEDYKVIKSDVMAAEAKVEVAKQYVAKS